MNEIRLPKKPDSAASALRDAILSGGIAPGEELTQNDLAAALGVSRMPVREALIGLEYQGLVERLPNQHVRAVRTDRRFFEDAFALAAAVERRILEDGAARIPAVSDELAFHRALCAGMPCGLPRRTLETAVEAYIQYAVGCPGRDVPAALDALRRAANGNAETALQEYYAGLLRAVMEGRDA